MRKSNLLKVIIVAVLVAIYPTVQLFSADFQITKVIEVGPADRVPFLDPLKWSPDGTRLSYFRDGWLMLSDTLGQSLPVYKATMYPHSYEWLSDNEIVLLQLSRIKGGKVTRMSIIDLKTGHEEIVVDQKEIFREALENDSIFFDRPRLSVEGNVYYNLVKRSGTRSALPESKYVKKKENEVLATNHFLAWGQDGLYKVRLDRKDSLRIGPKIHPNPLFPPVLSHDGRFAIYRGTIIRLADSILTRLDTLIKSRPSGTVVCGEVGIFSATLPEVLFQRSCDDGESYEVLSVWVYDLDTAELTSIDSLANLKGCNSPCYAPDGITIACLSEGKVYLIKRRVL